ncbi:MAG: hypothetical protein PVI70_17605 [Gammaproteobacteria bacterium]
MSDYFGLKGLEIANVVIGKVGAYAISLLYISASGDRKRMEPVEKAAFAVRSLSGFTGLCDETIEHSP